MNVELRNSNCPVCKTPLSNKNIDDKYDIQYCSSCRREYFQIQNDEKSKLKYNDLETASESEYNSEPILLCEKSKEPSPDSFLRRHFGPHCEITTELYIPEPEPE